ncbi:MAG: malto-oligosyltrehalose synthase [Bosea sp. (in: a-proteobacteria)]
MTGPELTAPLQDEARPGAPLPPEGRGGEPHETLAPPPPRATYRLQFHAGFGFDDAVAIVPYLARLGVSHVYASPIQTARPGSTHGYDIVDHARINPELGGEDGFLRLSEALKRHGLGLILDIVPNHMGIGGADNAWWLSVIEWGRLSPHAVTFDIDWDRLGANGKLVLPFLGKRYGDALEAGELKLARDESGGGFSVWHFEHRFPICPLTYPILLDRVLILVAAPAMPEYRELLAISSRLRTLSETAAGAADGVVEECEALKRRLALVFAASPEVTQAAERALDLVNGAKGIPESFDTLHRMLELQSYRLANWRVAASDINYRRFFDINTLAGVRVEEAAVFERTHALILDLVRAGRLQGLRIDHIDGLADPEGYVRTLQEQVGPGFYILVEKILGHGEALRPWPIAGTTGYEVLNLIDGSLIDRAGAEAIEAAYREISGQQESFEELLRRAKRETLLASFASELEVLVSDLARLAHGDRSSRDYTIHAMRQVLTEIIERLPVYRSYIATEPADEDRSLIAETVAAAIAGTSMPDTSLHRFVARLLLGEAGETMTAPPAPEHLARFRRRFQQLSGPVTAKSLEDTLFYRFGPLLALNEVGGEPSHHGVALEDFHAANAERRRAWPHAMIATATHDTKRGEDGRARLLALTEMPQRWREASRRWQSMSQALAAGRALPDANDRQMILQQLLASWPFALLDGDDAAELEEFCGRMQGWVEKALREAKRRTSWINPNEAYENAAKELLAAALAPGSAFLTGYRPLAQDLARRGMLRGLSRTVLKLTLPGVPDFYQGSEFWDLSLVDPDNRRPVDYRARSQALEAEGDMASLLASWPDGRVKQRVVASLLKDRAACPALYAEGDYEPLALQGRRAGDLLGFSRRHPSGEMRVIVTRIAGSESALETAPLGAHWRGVSAAGGAGVWEEILSGRRMTGGHDGLDIAEVLAAAPVAVLRRR